MTLDDLYRQLTPRVAAAFRDAVADVTDNAVLKRLIEAVARGDADAAFRAIDFDPAVFNSWYYRLADVFERGAAFALSLQPKRVNGSMLRFNMRDKRAEQWLQDHSAQLVGQINEDVRQTVRTTMTAGLAEGRNPRNVALDLIGRVDPSTGKRTGGVVGLGTREEEWSRNARTRLTNLDATYLTMDLRDKRFDRTVQKAIDDGTPLPAATVDKLVDRYRDNALKFRGEGIARTETMAALNRSEWVALSQSVEKGDIRRDAVQRTWKTAYDQRVRHTHRDMNGQTVGIDEPFVSPSGARLMFPGDTSLGAGTREVLNCRCSVSTFVDWSLGVT